MLAKRLEDKSSVQGANEDSGFYKEEDQISQCCGEDEQKEA